MMALQFLLVRFGSCCLCRSSWCNGVYVVINTVGGFIANSSDMNEWEQKRVVLVAIKRKHFTIDMFQAAKMDRA